MRFVAFVVFCSVLSLSCGDEENKGGQQMTWHTYRKLLEVKHKSQQSAVKNLYGMDSQERMLSMIQVLLKGMFKVIVDGQQTLTGVGYLPGEFVPEEEGVREALSSVLENTIFFSEVMLRFPDMCHQLYDRNKGWNEAIKWSILFINETQILEGMQVNQAIHLVSQEINLVPRDPSYVNPFTKKNMMKFMEEQGHVKAPSKKKSEKKKKAKGPRLSRTEL